MKIHLGVLDVPYSNNRKGMTTGDVAEILEDKYHPMKTFFDFHAKDIAKDLEKGLSGALESLLAGAPLRIDAFGSATSRIEDRFKQFLSNREMDAAGMKGVPTKAAMKGVSHRFKHPYARRAPRPSFIDTGLYQKSFKAWVES